VVAQGRRKHVAPLHVEPEMTHSQLHNEACPSSHALVLYVLNLKTRIHATSTE